MKYKEHTVSAGDTVVAFDTPQFADVAEAVGHYGHRKALAILQAAVDERTGKRVRHMARSGQVKDKRGAMKALSAWDILPMPEPTIEERHSALCTKLAPVFDALAALDEAEMRMFVAEFKARRAEGKK